MKKTADLALVGLFTALTAVCAWISLPFAVPVTMQTFAVILGAGLLGTKRSLLSVGGYILLGAVGAPVFSGFKGGLSVLLSPTGGYILGFLLLALSVGLAADLSKGKILPVIFGVGVGQLLCWLFGTLWFVFIFPQATAVSLSTALITCVFSFIIPDGVKAAAAVFLIYRLRRVLKI